MGLYGEHVLPRIVDRACNSGELRDARSRVTRGLAGVVVEVGFGSGLNLPHLPPAVERLLAVEPSTTARRLAGDRVAASTVPVEFVGLDGAHLPLADGAADAALSTFTLCTIPDVEAALAELRRVLRPGGQLHLLEHGLSPRAPVARWQHRLSPLQGRLFGGCHLDRPIDRLLADAGFEVSVRNHRVGPEVAGWLYEGVARKPA